MLTSQHMLLEGLGGSRFRTYKGAGTSEPLGSKCGSRTTGTAGNMLLDRFRACGSRASSHGSACGNLRATALRQDYSVAEQYGGSEDPKVPFNRADPSAQKKIGSLNGRRRAALDDCMSLPLNAGAQALAAVDSIANTAAKLGCSPRIVSGWRSGRKIPNEGSRATIERVYGIARALWDKAASSEPTGPAAPPHAPEGVEARESAEARLQAQLARLRAQRADPELTERGRLELEKLELAASRALARAEGLELTERQILASVAWRRVCDRMVSALEPWPDAMRAVAAALDALDVRVAA